MIKVGIVDYQLNNLKSVNHAVIKQGYESIILTEPEMFESVDMIILPGVGAYSQAMKNLKEKNLDEATVSFAKKGSPVLGICLGMQLLLDKSYEFKETIGLGLVKGTVKKLESSNSTNISTKIPNTGWRKINVNVSNNNLLLSNLDNKFMYFVHSYYSILEDKNLISSMTRFDHFDFCSSFAKDNIIGMQFHPEKSGKDGLSIYGNITKLFI